MRNLSTRSARRRLAPALLTIMMMTGPGLTALSPLPAQASEKALRALAARGLTVAPDVFAAETRITWQSGADASLPGPGFQARIPGADGAAKALIGGPRGAVIVDLLAQPGPAALSPRVAEALGLQPGRATDLQVVALRRLSRVAATPMPRTEAPTLPRAAPAPKDGFRWE